MTKFGDSMRARFAQRLRERTAEAAGAVAGKLPVAGPPPVAEPVVEAAAPPPRKRRPVTWKRVAKEQVRVLNLAAQGGAFQEPLDRYFKKRSAAEAARGRKKKDEAYKKAMKARLAEYREGVWQIARGLLDEPLDPRISFKWTSRWVGPRFRIAPEAT